MIVFLQKGALEPNVVGDQWSEKQNTGGGNFAVYLETNPYFSIEPILNPSFFDEHPSSVFRDFGKSGDPSMSSSITPEEPKPNETPRVPEWEIYRPWRVSRNQRNTRNPWFTRFSQKALAQGDPS